MSKDPAFLFYPGDWLGGTMLFSRSHKGAYMDLLMAQFNNGHMGLQEIKIILGSDFESMWESTLKVKFIQDEDEKYYNQRLDNEKLKRQKYTDSRKRNLKKTEQHISSHMESHMENENKDKDKDLNKDKYRDKIKEIVLYLNNKTGKNYKNSTPKTAIFIKARIREGFSVDDFKKVIDIKSDEWKGSIENDKFLRPETLFGTKFEGYLNQKPETPESVFIPGEYVPPIADVPPERRLGNASDYKGL